MLYIMILFIALLTALTRFLPFFIFRNKAPKVITDLGILLPPSLIAMIFVYSCKDMLGLDNIDNGVYGLIGIMFVLFLHVMFKNILVSIFCGTLFYLILRNYDLISSLMAS
ncbi:branched-chain amino acid transporter permease [Helicobacter bilis]|uniref:branched-chain amino acid transporter permease n=1 Tax=Helicobacter bilis TaxID=37372 RepID=UPI00248EBD68|nr:AzlD domain-containing protein [Helicobacter bilis]